MSFYRRKIDVRSLPDVVRHKWNNDVEVLDEGFVPLPKRFLRGMRRIFESPEVEQIVVVLAIVDYKRPQVDRPPSLDYLAFTAGMEPGRFMSVAARLKQKGLLRWHGPHEAITFELSGLNEAILRSAPDED